MPGESIAGRIYRTAREAPLVQLTVEPTCASDGYVHLWSYDAGEGEHAGVLLTPDEAERLGLDLQMRAAYMRGVRPPNGPEPDPVAGPDDGTEQRGEHRWPTTTT